MKFEIKSRWDARILFSLETDTLKLCVEAAVKSWANLSGADLSGANLYGYFSFGPGGSRNTYTWARWEEAGYMVHCGCKTLNLKDFEAAVKEKHGKTFHAKWYLANIATMKIVARESKAAFEDKKKIEGKRGRK